MGADSQGGHACLIDDAPDLGAGVPVLASRADVVLAHYLLAHNQSGNMWNRLRQIVYYRLAATGHRDRWADTQTDALLEYAPVRVSATAWRAAASGAGGGVRGLRRRRWEPSWRAGRSVR
jgi:hypothetical protein